MDHSLRTFRWSRVIPVILAILALTGAGAHSLDERPGRGQS